MPNTALNALFLTPLIWGLIGVAHATQSDAEPPLPSVEQRQQLMAIKAQAWPRPEQARTPDPALEARIVALLKPMTLAQKVGQMTQPEIQSITADEIRRYAIGSVLNGGGSWPDKNKAARAADWLALAQRYRQASLQTGLAQPIPLIWGTDAIHGHSNVMGATLFPHNIGLGAAHDPTLVREIAQATAKAVRATGIDWVFAPTLAVAQNLRWGRSYESFSSDPAWVRAYAKAYVEGLQAWTPRGTRTLATAKHFIGDGGTENGVDQGLTQTEASKLIAVHSQGYYGALEAGVQTVMASFNSWTDPLSGIRYGKMHGSQALLSGLLKERLGFDGLVVSDWNGIGQVPGCSDADCPQAINAGVDLVMVPTLWREFIANTVAAVEDGRIPMARIDDAVSRILRVKLRAGLFEHAPGDAAEAGSQQALLARDLARRAVLASAVLLKNNGKLLPLRPGSRVLVVGKSANSLANQSGGWSLSWQGDLTSNADFPHADTVLAALRKALGARAVVFDEAGTQQDPRRFDAVIAVLGETPYAEGKGDIPPGDTLRHSSRHPEDLAALRAVSGRGRPVLSLLISGRPLFVNDLLNLSDAFVAAWLPGTEARGLTDLLVQARRAKPAQDFSARLSFEWPLEPCGKGQAWPRGHGLQLAAQRGQDLTLAQLPEWPEIQHCPLE